MSNYSFNRNKLNFLPTFVVSLIFLSILIFIITNLESLSQGKYTNILFNLNKNLSPEEIIAIFENQNSSSTSLISVDNTPKEIKATIYGREKCTLNKIEKLEKAIIQMEKQIFWQTENCQNSGLEYIQILQNPNLENLDKTNLEIQILDYTNNVIAILYKNYNETSNFKLRSSSQILVQDMFLVETFNISTAADAYKIGEKTYYLENGCSNLINKKKCSLWYYDDEDLVLKILVEDLTKDLNLNDLNYSLRFSKNQNNFPAFMNFNLINIKNNRDLIIFNLNYPDFSFRKKETVTDIVEYTENFR
jgi:hypothetical protein